MDENKSITYDDLIQTRNTQILKSIVPYLDVPAQKPLAMLIQLMEWKNATAAFSRQENSMAACSPVWRKLLWHFSIPSAGSAWQAASAGTSKYGTMDFKICVFLVWIRSSYVMDLFSSMDHTSSIIFLFAFIEEVPVCMNTIKEKGKNRCMRD